MHANMCVIVSDTLALDLFDKIAQSKMKITKVVGFWFKSVVKKQIKILKSFTVVWCFPRPCKIHFKSNLQFNS